MLDSILILAQRGGDAEAAGALCGMFCVLMIIPLSLAITGFQIWMIVDVATYESKMPDSQLLLWLLLIIFLGPIPALIYYFVRRPNNRHGKSGGYGQQYHQPPPHDPYWRPPY